MRNSIVSRESSNRLAGLDLIRGFAAFAVAVSHYMIACKLETRLFETTSAVAVEIFFVLSGYVLAPQIAFCLFSTARYRNLGIFFTRRWMRTVPPYFIALFAISMSAKELWSHDFWRYAFYVQNLTSQSNQHDYYTVAWSLSVEEWFYISFPIFLGVIALITRRSNATAVVWGALAYITLVSAGRLHFGDYADWGNEVRRVVAYRVDAIAWGYVLFMILKRVGDVSSARASIAACIWSISTIFIFLVSNSIADTEDRLAEHIFPLAAAAFGMTSIWMGLCIEPFVAVRRRLRLLSRFFGRISYSVYLFHLLVLDALLHMDATRHPVIGLAFYLLATTAFAWVFFSAVEQPILARRPSFIRDSAEDVKVGIGSASAHV